MKKLFRMKTHEYYLKLIDRFLHAFNDKQSLAYIYFLQETKTSDLIYLLPKCTERKFGGALAPKDRILLGLMRGELDPRFKPTTPEGKERLQALEMQLINEGVDNHDLVRNMISTEIARRLQNRAVIISVVFSTLAFVVSVASYFKKT